jgi:hypothetical protein
LHDRRRLLEAAGILEGSWHAEEAAAKGETTKDLSDMLS